MSKKKKLVIAAAVLIFAAAGVMGSHIYTKWQMSNTYSVIYLSTGEIYVGKLSYMPLSKFELVDAYLLQAVKNAEDETKTNFQLASLKDSLWSPKKLYLNPDQVVFYGLVEEGSSASEALRSAGK